MRMLTFLHNLQRNKRGGVALIAALVVPCVLLAAGGGVDFARVVNEKSAMRDVADAGALAGAKALAVPGADPSAVKQVVNDYLNANAFPWNITSETVDVNTSTQVVTVTAGTNLPMYFLSMVGMNQIPVSATAAAKVGQPTGLPVCVGVLDPTSQSAVSASGSAALNASPCNVWINSSSKSSVTLSGSATIKGAKNCFVGGVSSSSSVPITPTPTSCGAFKDPFAGINPTTPASCTFSNFSRSGGTNNLTPGVYCGGINISSASATLQPGLYVLRNGSLTLSGGSSISGDGVVFVLEGTSTINLSGAANVHLTAPTSGQLAGFVFFQRSNADPGARATLSGSSGMYIEGVVYFPTQTLSLSGSSSSSSPSPFSSYIANDLQFSGSSSINIGYDPTSATVPIPSGLYTEPGIPILVQ